MSGLQLDAADTEIESQKVSKGQFELLGYAGFLRSGITEGLQNFRDIGEIYSDQDYLCLNSK